MLESLFNKVAGLTPILKNISQRLLLHCTRITRCYLSVLLYIQQLPLQRLFLVQILISEVNFIDVIFFFHVFLSFSVLSHFFLSLLVKRILLS